MDSMNSFSGYGRMKEFEERIYRQKTRKRLTIISISTFLLLAIIIGITVAAVANKHSNSSTQRPSPISTPNSIKALCAATRYPDCCDSSISSAKGSNTTENPKEFFKLSLQVAIEALKNFSTSSSSVVQMEDESLQGAVRDCKGLFDDAIDRLHDSLALLQAATGEKFLAASEISDLRTWLSAAITDQQTCMDGFEGAASDVVEAMKAAMASATQLTSNSLAIATKILARLENSDGFAHNRRLLQESPPTWLSSSQRRAFLQEESSRLEPNVTVAKDGSGRFRTIKEALDLVPKKNGYPFVIYVREGVYEEIVSVDKDKWNVTMIGDGMYKTIVTGNLSHAIINSTKLTATFTAVGRGFMARDMGFKNTAGPESHQAVALRATSDHSVFYRCSFDAYQDTLYVHSLRQFYRECVIIGTVDFIFGDAAAIFQSCSIRPRQPMPDQKNTITAQGRTDPNENTGMVIQQCIISPHGNVTVPTYLGRPWKDYSTTVIMRSEIGGMVDPLGWLPWTDDTVPPDTIYYAEYQNSGPGSNVTGRVRWPGYRPTISRNEAEKYQVDNFIQAGDWLPLKGIEFESTV
ncbi:pectinesterase 3-like [Elaeis guineensis]|uniref:pectinesterase 3-like n=1 Tax=Elaeis guineensis var. tenera TaxID=51953 RepID=UPI003C6CC5CD